MSSKPIRNYHYFFLNRLMFVHTLGVCWLDWTMVL